MKAIYVLFAGFTLLVSCNSKPVNHEIHQPDTTDKSIEISRSFVDAYNKHDLNALEKLYAKDATIETVDFSGKRLAMSAIRKTYRDYFNGAPDLKAVVRKIIVNGNDIAIAFACQGTITSIQNGDPELRNHIPESMKDGYTAL